MKSAELKALLQDTFGHLDDKQLMALTIYGEARGESEEGKIAVGSVILERVDHRNWDGKTIHEVCLCPFQFSCFLPNDQNFKSLKLIADDWDMKYMRSMDLQDCYHTAFDMLAGRIPRTKEIADSHATQYLTTALRKSSKCPSWVKDMKKVVTVGAHEFYS
jgi:N-acetylmuramoyl-L-alanine amidase